MTQICPECDAAIESIDDVEFVEWDTADDGWTFRAAKVMYVVACVECGAAVGGGVAGGR